MGLLSDRSPVARSGVLDLVQGLREDQPARAKRQNLAGMALWCSGARTAFALGVDLLAP
jgi:hypothetical protein